MVATGSAAHESTVGSSWQIFVDPRWYVLASMREDMCVDDEAVERVAKLRAQSKVLRLIGQWRGLG